MKTLILLIALVLSATSLNAQSKYETAMTKAMDQYKAGKTAKDMLDVSALFERIAEAEKDKWLPYYYAALTNNMASWIDEKSDKDKLAEKSLVLVAKAEALEANNAELFCLRNMIASSQMMVDPMSRWQSYGMEASNALTDAKKADPNNPRIYFLEGQGVFNTPEAFGGGKKNAKPLFEKSVTLFETFTLASPFHPDWGKDDATEMLKACE
jgi:hypothetical protein